MNATLDLAAFYALLAKTPRDWYLSPHGLIRRKVGTLCQCPLSSIQGRSDRIPYNVAFNIGMNAANAAEVICAADLKAGFDNNVRAELLRACGLETTS